MQIERKHVLASNQRENIYNSFILFVINFFACLPSTFCTSVDLIPAQIQGILYQSALQQKSCEVGRFHYVRIHQSLQLYPTLSVNNRLLDILIRRNHHFFLNQVDIIVSRSLSSPFSFCFPLYDVLIKLLRRITCPTILPPQW